MAIWCVFNGDADGLCAAHQLRLAGHVADHLITGVKRDISLLKRCTASAGDQVWVADISLDANRAALEHLLGSGVSVIWFDHHHAGDIPPHPGLEVHIDMSPAVCSSLLVDDFLGGRFRAWAVTAAFGDNLVDAARTAAGGLSLAGPELDQLAELGVLINYNAYGETVADLHVDPAKLLARMAPYTQPGDFLAHDSLASDLRVAMQQDLEAARGSTMLHADHLRAAIELPDAPWARRAHGIYANELATAHPARAHAILVASPQGYAVSVRAPVCRPQGADALCRQFVTGGGRAGAAGINQLPRQDLQRFLEAFRHAYR